jgi:UDP-N-acetylmuramate dehydrogenase
LAELDREALARALGGEGEVLFDEPLARHTTLRIGGPVDAWVEPETVEAVQRVRALCAGRGWPCRAMGAGSNLLVRDGGVRGVLVAMRRLRTLEFQPTDEVPPARAMAGATAGAVGGLMRVRVGAGVSTGKLLSEATRRGLGGVEFLGGVPGTVGGGLIMNAGTYLGEFKDVTTRVRAVDGRGALVEREGAACGFVYRGSVIPAEEVVVEGELLLWPRPSEAIEADVHALRERRRAREPHNVPNAGSIFKNPPGDYAGRLIEACGLKGRRIGGAEVSPVHANWIVNADGARAADVLALIELVRHTVAERFGVRLELEVRVVGEG